MDHPIPHDDATIVALQHDLLSARERLTGRRTFDADLAALESSINAMRAAGTNAKTVAVVRAQIGWLLTNPSTERGLNQFGL